MIMLRRYFLFGALVLSGMMMAGCDQSEPVAYVNGSEINQDDYLSLMEMKQNGAGQTDGQATLNSMIQNCLIVQEAEKEGVAPGPDEMQGFLTGLRQNPVFQEQISQTGLTDEQVIHMLIEPQLCTIRLVANMVHVTDGDVQQYFNQNKAQFKQPASVEARILQVADRNKADEALKLVGKSSFESIIQTFGGTSMTGGNPTQVQSLQKGGMSPYPKEVVDAAFATPKGQASKVIEATPQASPFQQNAAPPTKQYYVVFVEDKLAEREPDLKNPLTKFQALQSVVRTKGSTLSPTAVQDMLTQLRQKAQVSVVRPSVKSAEKPPAPTAPVGGGAPPASSAPNAPPPAPSH